MDPGTQIRALRVSFRRQTAPSQRGKDPFRGEFKHRPQRHRAEAFSQVQKNIFQAIVELERYAAGSRSVPNLVHPCEIDPFAVFIVPDSQRTGDQFLACLLEKFISPAAVPSHDFSHLQDADLIFLQRVVLALYLRNEPENDSLLVNAQSIPSFSHRVSPHSYKVAV